VTKHSEKAWPYRIQRGEWTVCYWTTGYDPETRSGTRPVINRYGMFATKGEAEAYIARMWK